MSLAAFSVLVVAFLFITGEASVVPSIPPPSSSSADTKSSFSTTHALMGGGDRENLYEVNAPQFRVGPGEEERELGPTEWSEKALADWCYGNDIKDEDGGIRIDREKAAEAEMKLRHVLCQIQSPSLSHITFRHDQ